MDELVQQFRFNTANKGIIQLISFNIQFDVFSVLSNMQIIPLALETVRYKKLTFHLCL